MSKQPNLPLQEKEQLIIELNNVFLGDDTVAPEGHWYDKKGTLWTRSKDSGIPITVTQIDDPARRLLRDGHISTPVVYRKGCYICEDPEFAQMGLPLCRACSACGGHVAADDCMCDDCGYDERFEQREEHD